MGSLFSEVAESGEPVLVEVGGQRVAAVVSPDDFDKLALANAWDTIREIQELNAHRDPNEILSEVTAIVEEVRQEMYDAELRAKGGH